MKNFIKKAVKVIGGIATAVVAAAGAVTPFFVGGVVAKATAGALIGAGMIPFASWTLAVILGIVVCSFVGRIIWGLMTGLAMIVVDVKMNA